MTATLGGCKVLVTRPHWEPTPAAELRLPEAGRAEKRVDVGVELEPAVGVPVEGERAAGLGEHGLGAAERRPDQRVEPRRPPHATSAVRRHTAVPRTSSGTCSPGCFHGPSRGNTYSA